MTKLTDFIKNLNHEQVMVTFELLLEMEVFVGREYKTKNIKDTLIEFIQKITTEYENKFNTDFHSRFNLHNYALFKQS